MTKTRIHDTFSRLLVILILAATFHFQAPLANRAMDKKCCVNSEMACCKGDIPGRTVCCIEHTEHDSENAAPIRAIPHSNQSLTKLLAAGLNLPPTLYQIPQIALKTNLSTDFFLHQDNHLYLQNSSLLI